MNDIVTLIESENSDYKQIAYFCKINGKNKLVIAKTKEFITPEVMKEITDILIDFELVKDDFAVYNVFINEKQMKLADKLKSN